MPRFLHLLPLLAILSACGPRTLPPTDRPEIKPIAGIAVGTELSPGGDAIARDSMRVSGLHPTVALRTHRLRPTGLKLTLLTFDARQHRLQVVDNENGPGTGATTARAAAARLGGLAAINGGFFTPEGKPLGLVIEDGTKYGHLSSSSLGSGLYHGRHHGQLPALLRRNSRHQDALSARNLLQSGPFLLEEGKPVRGLSSSRPRERSFLLWDGGAGWALGHSSSTTLAALSQALAGQPAPDFTIRHALNLDGGTSSDLWVASSVKGGPVSTRHFWNKDVRNYLVLTPTP